MQTHRTAKQQVSGFSTATTIQVKWSRQIFAALPVFAVLLNLGRGVLQQLEEVLLLPKDARGQTLEVEVGWPFRLLSTRAYTLELVPLRKPALLLFLSAVDIVLNAVLVFSGTRYLSAIADSCNWRFNVGAAVAIVTLFALLLVEGRDFFWYHQAVGACSHAIFECVAALKILCSLFAIHWLIAEVGRQFGFTRIHSKSPPRTSSR